jgi:flagellar assembly protein FliH
MFKHFLDSFFYWTIFFYIMFQMPKNDDPGKVQLKTILKGSAAQAIRPAAMAGFKVAEFQMNPKATMDSAEDRLRAEVTSLQSQIATLKGEAENLKNKTEQEVKSAHDKGFQDGKTIGTTDGEKKAIEKWKTELAALQGSVAQTFESMAAQQKENFQKIESITTEIAIAIAKRIFCEEAIKNPNIMARILKETFAFLGQEEKLKVRLNPLDISSAQETESFWKPAMGSLKSVELVPDATIEKGGCLLESENGSSVDMRVQTVLGHIEETVRQIYSS